MTDFCFSAFMDYDILEKLGKKKTSAQRQKRKKTLLGRPIFTLNLYSLVAVLRNQGRCFLSVIPSS